MKKGGIRSAKDVAVGAGSTPPVSRRLQRHRVGTRRGGRFPTEVAANEARRGVLKAGQVARAA